MCLILDDSLIARKFSASNNALVILSTVIKC
jgi:hypothetical protein